jgi:hypothetical protein
MIFRDLFILLSDMFQMTMQYVLSELLFLHFAYVCHLDIICSFVNGIHGNAFRVVCDRLILAASSG